MERHNKECGENRNEGQTEDRPETRGENYQEKHDLDYVLKAYRLGMVSRHELEERVYLNIREQPYYHLNLIRRDFRADYVQWLYPRLRNAIDRYQDMGSTFDAYIASMVRFTIREYTSHLRERRIMERTWWRARAEEFSVREEEPVYDDEADDEAPPKRIRNRRQVLMLILKSYYYLSDHHLEKFAAGLGMSKEALSAMVNEVRDRRVKQEDMIHLITERMYSQYYRCIGFEKRLLAMDSESPAWAIMKRRVDVARKRLLSIRRRLASMRTEATNNEVADVMGVTKGSVDAYLFAAKQNIESR
ncbi:MAG: hypothetical protein LBN92_00315 [Treponema sp.]|jgi:hypothetical protein|nr:hypothetical protein [Treponema sp.]